MTQQIIDIGDSANDGTGDPLRTAFEKINDNFTQLYELEGDQGAAPPSGSVQFAATNSLKTISYNSGTWVIFGAPLRYFISTDGINWSNNISPINH